MKVSESWLREWVNPSVDTDKLAAQLTMAGLEVDGVEPAGPTFDHLVVAEVVSTEKHPDADKLTVCQVNVGAAETVQIVCGAANVRVGIKVPCAMIGAQLAPDFKIKKAKLRGVESNGMLCAASELGLAMEKSPGLMELPADAPVGANFCEYINVADAIIEVDLTPNRADCLSIKGIAREVGVFNSTDLTPPAIEKVAASTDAVFPISVTATADCPRYVGRVIKGVNPKATTPLWMVEKLRRGGIRAISPLVDVTNYVLLELGQPMHAFDLAKLTGSIDVRRATKDEPLTLLDGTKIKLDEKVLVIADDNGPLALAGVMGGEASGCGDDTQDILLESAFFQPATIAGRARRFGLHTDSSHRFERGVDYALQEDAIEYATNLILDICGGDAGPTTEVSSDADLPKAAEITLRHARLEKILGISVPKDEVTEILTRLGGEVTTNDDSWTVVAPSYRFDMEIEADLIEEVGRIRGYDNIPTNMGSAAAGLTNVPETLRSDGCLTQPLMQRGYQEAITYSFVDAETQALVEPEQTGVNLANPLSAELAQMRTSTWTGLLKALKHNINRQQNRVRFFELGQTFCREQDTIHHDWVVGGLVYGPVAQEQWGTPTRDTDFFDVKSDVEALLGPTSTAIFAPGSHPALHPGQTAAIQMDGETIGLLGTIHPRLQAKLGLAKPCYLFEIKQAPLRKSGLPKYFDLPQFPAVRRDLAIVVPEEIGVESVRNVIREAAGSKLENLVVFDVYQGQGIESNQRSVAIGLILQDYSATLTDSEVEDIVNNVTEALNAKLGVTIRV